MKARHLFLISILALVFVSCNKKESKPLNFDYGKVENAVYKNSYFKFSIDLPSNWEFLTQKESQNLLDAESADKNMQTQTSVNLLTALEDEKLNPNADFLANLSIIAENLKGSDRVKNGTDYLMLTRKALDDKGIKHEYPDKGSMTEKINGTEFSTMRVNTVEPGLTFSQKFYTTIVNGYALTFIQSYVNENQLVELDKTMQSLEFK